MWVCEHDGTVVADKETHREYMGHTKYREVSPDELPRRTPKRAPQTDEQPAGKEPERVAPDWYREEKDAGVITGIQGVENWPPHSPKAEVGKVEEE